MKEVDDDRFLKFGTWITNETNPDDGSYRCHRCPGVSLNFNVDRAGLNLCDACLERANVNCVVCDNAGRYDSPGWPSDPCACCGSTGRLCDEHAAAAGYKDLCASCGVTWVRAEGVICGECQVTT